MYKIWANTVTFPNLGFPLSKMGKDFRSLSERALASQSRTRRAQQDLVFLPGTPAHARSRPPDQTWVSSPPGGAWETRQATSPQPGQQEVTSGQGPGGVKVGSPQEERKKVISGRRASMICLVLGELWVSRGAGTWHADTWRRGRRWVSRLGGGLQGLSMLWEEPGLDEWGTSGSRVSKVCPEH